MLVLHHINSEQKQSNSLICMFTIDETSPESPQVATPQNKSSYVRGKRAEQLFHPIVLEAANRHQIDPALVKAVIMAESSYNPRAISKRGAKGLMQLMPETAKSLGVEDIFNPEHNINAGVKYLRHLMNQFDGDTKLALAAYNAGSRKVRQYSGIPPFSATKYYIKKVFRYYKYYKEEMEAEVSRV
jgi:soluble lytic murein transglycosylase-like protein